jgi:hypothetical protein
MPRNTAFDRHDTPLRYESKENVTNRGEAVGYLQQLGYLGGTAESTVSDTTEPTSEVLAVALREFQGMALIPKTGELDDATVAAMARPRCPPALWSIRVVLST